MRPVEKLLLVAAVAATVPCASSAQDYSVGVISGDGTCPGGSATVVHRMDEEDGPCVSPEWGTVRVGWVGATVVQVKEQSSTVNGSGGVHLTWCEVDGTQFRPLAPSYDPANAYAVLKLGSACPPGSTEFVRYFDNEDTHNTNWVTGDIWPNVVDRNTTLHFCLYREGYPAMTAAPNLGVSYGVLAAANFPLALAAGYVRANDEMTDNTSTFSAPPTIDADARRVVTPLFDGGTAGCGALTILNMASISTGREPRCGLCGGTVRADGTCSVATPPGVGQPCGCGGKVQCNGTCTTSCPPPRPDPVCPPPPRLCP